MRLLSLKKKKRERLCSCPWKDSSCVEHFPYSSLSCWKCTIHLFLYTFLPFNSFSLPRCLKIRLLFTRIWKARPCHMQRKWRTSNGSSATSITCSTHTPQKKCAKRLFFAMQTKKLIISFLLLLLLSFEDLLSKRQSRRRQRQCG